MNTFSLQTNSQVGDGAQRVSNCVKFPVRSSIDHSLSTTLFPTLTRGVAGLVLGMSLLFGLVAQSSAQTLSVEWVGSGHSGQSTTITEGTAFPEYKVTVNGVYSSSGFNLRACPPAIGFGCSDGQKVVTRTDIAISHRVTTSTAGEDRFNSFSSSALGSTIEHPLSTTVAGPATATFEDTFTSSNLHAKLVLVSTNNSTPEADSVIEITISAPNARHGANARTDTFTPVTLTLTITDDDASSISVGSGTTSKVEGETLAFPVAVTGPLGAAVKEAFTFSYTVTNTAGTVATGDATGTGTFAANDRNDSRRTIMVPTAFDNVDVDGSVTVTLNAAGTGGFYNVDSTAASATKVLTDSPGDTGRTQVSLAVVGNSTITEGASLPLQLTLSRGLDVANATVELKVEHGRSGANFFNFNNVTDGSITFGISMADSGTKLTYSPTDLSATTKTATDNTPEPNSEVVVTVVGGTGYAVGTPSAVTFTVADDDTSTVRIASGFGIEGGEVRIPITLLKNGVAANTSEPLTIRYDIQLTDNVASSLTGNPKIITIGAGESAGTILIQTQAGTSTNKEVQVRLLEPASGGNYYVLEDPTRPIIKTTLGAADSPTVSIGNAANVREGGMARFPITLSTAFPGEISLKYTVAANGDYGVDVGSGKTLTIPNRATTAFIEVATTIDEVVDASGTITVTLTGGANYVLASMPTRTVTVTDTPPPLARVRGGSVQKGMGLTAEFTVSLAVAPSTNVTVGYDLSEEPSGANVVDTGRFGTTGKTVMITPANSGKILVATKPAVAGVTYVDSVIKVTLIDGVGYRVNNTPSSPAEFGTVTVADSTISPEQQQRNDALADSALPVITQAVAAQAAGAVVTRIGQIRAVASAGDTSLPRTSLAGTDVGTAIVKHSKGLADGTLDAKTLLSGSSFSMPMPMSNGAFNFGEGAGISEMVFWGSGNYRDLSGESSGLDWEGDLTGFSLGLDARVDIGSLEDLVVGVSVSSMDGEFDYEITSADEDVGGKGDYTIDMITLQPYMGWRARGLDWHAAFGIGKGDIDTKHDGEDKESGDLSMQSLVVGASGELLVDGDTTMRLKGDVGTSKVEVDGSGAKPIADASVNATRLRVALESRHESELDSGAQFAPVVELGVWHDTGDSDSGTGLELGLGVSHHNTDGGVFVEGNFTALRSDDYSEWGLSGLVRVDPGKSGLGLALSVQPSYGMNGSSRMTELWQADFDAGKTAAPDVHYTARIKTRLGYGMSTPRGLVTPYSVLNFGDDHTYRIGSSWSITPQFNLDLSGEQKEAGTTTSQAVILKGSLEF